MIPAIVLAGGLGTRLRAISGDVPKPLVSVGNRPFLEYVLDTLVDAGVPAICLATSYRWELFQDHFGSAYRNTPLTYSVEHEPLGTGGAVLKCFRENQFRNALVINGDTLFKINLEQLITAHTSSNSVLTLALRSVTDVSRYGAVTRGIDGRILTFEEKGAVRPGLINAGIYIFERSAFERADLPQNFSLEVEFLRHHIDALRPLGFLADGYFVDIGVPEDLERARRDLGHAS